MVDTAKPLVTVTGISGFLGSWVCLLLLQQGKYRVRGTVRSIANASKIDPLRKAFGDLFEKLELVEAELQDVDAINRAVQGASYVIHVASPIVFQNPEDENTVIRPAVEGTLNVMRACHTHKVKRVSLTSSAATITRIAHSKAPACFDESHWSDVNLPGIGAYVKSKILAEHAALDYLESLPPSERFGLAVMNPSMIAGPMLTKTTSTSVITLNLWLKNLYPAGVPKITLSCVDVRDVAQAHIDALGIDEAQGKRFLLTHNMIWCTEITPMLVKHFGDRAFPIPTRESTLEEVKALVGKNPFAERIVAYWGRYENTDNSRSRNILRMKYRSQEDSLREMVESMITLGLTTVPGRPRL